MKIGYARVSTNSQDTALQIDALNEAGCEVVYEETGSGAKKDRPELESALKALRSGDCLVVWRLDRLSRSMKDLIAIVNDLEQRGIQFRSITDSIETKTHAGRLIFHIFGALAEFERNVIRERTHAGLKAARARGRKGGRKRILTDVKVMAAKLTLDHPENTKSVEEVAKDLGVSRNTLFREFKALAEKSDSSVGS